MTFQLDNVIHEIIPQLVSFSNMSAASKLQLIRQSKQLRTQLNIDVKVIVKLNQQIKKDLLNYELPPLQQNLDSKQICENASIILAQYPGLCYMIKSFILNNGLSLQDLLELDPATLQSENISLEALSLLYQGLNVLSIQIPHVMVARYVISYGNMFILTQNNFVFRAKPELQRPKQSTQYLLVVHQYTNPNRQVLHAVNQIYCFDASSIIISSSQEEPIDYGLVVKADGGKITITCSVYTCIELTAGTTFKPWQTVQLDLLNSKLTEYQLKYQPIGQIVHLLEIQANQMRTPVNRESVSETKIFEFLVATLFEVDGQFHIQFNISRQAGGFYKQLLTMNDDRVFVRTVYSFDNVFLDERKGLPAVNIFLPVVFTGCCLQEKNIVGRLQICVQNNINIIDFDENFGRKITFPLKAYNKEVDLACFKVEKAKIKFTFKNESSRLESKHVEDVLTQDEIDQLDAAECQCLVILNQDHQFKWCCQISHLVRLGGSQINMRCNISTDYKMQTEILQHPESIEPDVVNRICRLITTYNYDPTEMFRCIVSAYKLNQLTLHLPLDMLIEGYREYVKYQDNREFSQHFFSGEEYYIEISNFVLYYVNNLILVPEQMRIVDVTQEQGDQLPTFNTLPNSGLNFSIKAMQSDAIDGLSTKIESYSQNNSTNNSYVQQHNNIVANILDTNPLDNPIGLAGFSAGTSLFADHALSPQQNIGPYSLQPQTDNIFSQPVFSFGDYQAMSSITTMAQPLPQPVGQQIELNTGSYYTGKKISSLQLHASIDITQFKLHEITGYVRYHFPSYNIAVIAFCDPFHRQDSWNHSMAIWYLPEQIKKARLARNCDKNVRIQESGKGERIYIARALVKCTVHPMDTNSGVYVVDDARLIDYQDPCDKFKQHNQDNTNATVEGSVYWQEIPSSGVKKGASFGFVRLASGHERHFYLKDQKPVLGHLVRLKLFNNDNLQHPNSCELIQTLLPPPDRHKWLFGRIIQVFAHTDAQTEKTLNTSFRTSQNLNLQRRGGGFQILNGMILTEPMQGTHVDLCFFRLVLPLVIVEQIKPGVGVFFTLKELALHKVVDHTDSCYQTPVELVNDVLQGRVQQSKVYQQNASDIGNSEKLSCWAVDNICLPQDQYTGQYKNIPARKCSGLQAESVLLQKYGNVLINGMQSLIYVPRPTLNITPPIFKENEKFLFNVHFVFNEQKMGFTPESNQIKKIKSDISARRIKGKILLLNKMQRCPVYVFRPDAAQHSNVQMIDQEIGNVMQCLSDQLTPESNCYLVNTNAFYLLTNELLNKIDRQKLNMNTYKTLFKKLLSGEIDLYLKQVSIGLISDGEFERYDAMSGIIQQFQENQNQLNLPVNTGNQYFNNTANIFTGKDDQGNRRMLFWCRYVDELCLGDEVGEIGYEEDRHEEDWMQKAEVDFLSY